MRSVRNVRNLLRLPIHRVAQPQAARFAQPGGVRDNQVMARIVGVFPLPRVVLFPGTSLPLHIFEPRYRALVRDALDGDRSFAIALLKPGQDGDDAGVPEIYPIGCMGRIDEVVPLPDGRFLLTLTGETRVEFLELTRRAPYRRYTVRDLSETPPDEAALDADETLLRILSAYHQILSAAAGGASGMPLPTERPFALTVNRIAFGLDIDPAVKYQLLETGDLEARARQLLGILESALPSYLDLGSGAVN